MTIGAMLAVLTLAFCTVVLGWIVYSKSPKYRWFIGVVLIASFFVTTRYHLTHDPYLLAWLCNITSVLAIISYFRFIPRVFDVFVYFAWTGDVFTLLGWDNPLCPALMEHPISWTAFWLKHIAPLALSLYMFRVEGRRVTATSLLLALIMMSLYTCAMYAYNVLFDRNILDLITPTLSVEKAFGPWPTFVFVNVVVCVCWYWAIHWCLKKLDVVEA